jgi:1,5-anhydro-D-fructose reductase (1,5-anhydro-D-mannitol-forming)
MDNKTEASYDSVVRWGIIGLGRLPTELIAPAINQSSGSRLVACAGSTLEKARAFVDHFGAARAYSSIDELAADPEIDAIFIATPNALHHAMVLTAARAGKHILCEKPLALSVEEGRAMVEACRAAKVILRVGFQIRLEEILSRVREIVASGKLGELRAVQLERYAGPSFRVKPWRQDAAQGGIVFDGMVHLLDLVEWMTGLRFREISAYSHPDRRAGVADDTIAVLGNMDGACQAFLRASREIPYGENGLLMEGSKGMLVASPLRFADEYPLRVQTAEGIVEERFPATPIYQREIEAFEREVRGGARELASGEDGVRGIELTAAILEAINERRSVSL